MDWNSRYIVDLVRRALEEDIGTGDATTAATIPPRASARAHLLARQTLVCAGLPIAEKIFRTLDSEIQVTCPHNDGSFVEPGAELVKIKGNARAILTGERTALNFLAHLCGIAPLRGTTGGDENADSGYAENDARFAGAGKICGEDRRRREPQVRTL